MIAFDIRTSLLATILLVALGCFAPATFAETETESDEKNKFSILVGVTSETRRDKGPTLGLEYERRLDAVLGVGLLAEHVFGDLDFSILAVPLFFHTGRWKFLIAPGVEDSDLGTEFLLRIGGDYGFEVGRWEIAPGIDVDFVDGEVVPVIGVAIGRDF